MKIEDKIKKLKKQRSEYAKIYSKTEDLNADVLSQADEIESILCDLQLNMMSIDDKINKLKEKKKSKKRAK